MATQSPVTILKPIDEVVGYVMDANNWAEWGQKYYLSQTEAIGTDMIEATYNLPEGKLTKRWQVLHKLSGMNQLVTFTNKDFQLQTAEYIFTDKGAYTDVARNEANFDNKDDISSNLLDALKTGVEKRISSN